MVQSIRLGVVILAAGTSSRMGRPKLLLPWRGTSVVGHLIGQWQALGAEQIGVVCRADDVLLDGELNRLGFPQNDRIVNPEPERGMFSSILCAANWTGWQAGLTSWALVLGDQPHLREKTLRALLDFCREHANCICQPEQEGHARHPVVLPRHAMAALSSSRAATLREFLDQTDCCLNKCLVEDAGLGLDLDRPEDYRKAQNLRYA